MVFKFFVFLLETHEKVFQISPLRVFPYIYKWQHKVKNLHSFLYQLDNGDPQYSLSKMR